MTGRALEEAKGMRVRFVVFPDPQIEVLLRYSWDEGSAMNGGSGGRQSQLSRRNSL